MELEPQASSPEAKNKRDAASLCFWWGEARALSPAPPPASNGRPSPTALPPLGRAKWRTRHKMAAGPGHERAMTETKKAPRTPFPQHNRAGPSFLSVAVGASPPRHWRAVAAPRPYFGLPTPPHPLPLGSTIDARCLCTGAPFGLPNYPSPGGAYVKRGKTVKNSGTPAGPPLPTQDAPWVQEGSAPAGSPHSQL